jgi:hypothetical protein
MLAKLPGAEHDDGMAARNTDTEVLQPETYHTIDEAAERARRSVNAMRQLRIKGLGPKFRKVDGRLLVSGTDLERWLRGETVAEAKPRKAPKR